MFRNIIFITIILLLQSCHKTDHEIVNLNNNKIDVLGHAGMGISSSYPINSFESITKALALGADGTELDVQLTADGVLVVYHDQNLESSTNKSGIINDLTWAEIQGAHYTQIPYHDYKVVTLESVFAYTENLTDYRFALDCKLYSSIPDSNFLQVYASQLTSLLNTYKSPSKTIIESPDPELLKHIHQQGSNYLLFWYSNNIATTLEEAENWPIDGFTLRDDQASFEEIHDAHDEGYLVALYNTQSKSENIKAIEKNPDIIQTDKLKHLIKSLH